MSLPALIIALEELEEVEDIDLKTESYLETCPSCGEDTLEVVSKCATCINCGWSLCSM